MDHAKRAKLAKRCGSQQKRWWCQEVILFGNDQPIEKVHDIDCNFLFRVTSLADALRLDFALIHKDRTRSGPQGTHRPYSGMPTQNGNGTARSLITRVSNVENDDASDIAGGDDNTEDSMSVSVSSLNEMSAAVSVVADTDGEESTITLVGDVEGKVVFLTVSNHIMLYRIYKYMLTHLYRTISLMAVNLSWMPLTIW